MEIYKLQAEVWKIADEKGWHEKEIVFGDFISNCHAELSEAFEVFKSRGDLAIAHIVVSHGDLKPEGIPIELADVVIRILDYCEGKGINLETAIEMKKLYNATRSHRHGGKVV